MAGSSSAGRALSGRGSAGRGRNRPRVARAGRTVTPRSLLRRLLGLTAVLGAALLVVAAAEPVTPHVDDDATPACSTPTVTTLHLPDEGGTRDLVVIRPRGRDSASIPVLYLLHGFPGTEASMVPTARWLTQVACSAGRSLVVAIPDGNLGALDPEWGDDAARHLDLETFVTRTAVAAVEGRHRRPASSRIIAGFSMGGFGAAMIGMRHPDLYTRVLSVAGYFHLDDPDHVFGTSPATQAAHQPDRLVRSGSRQSFFLVDGASDPLALTKAETPRFAGLLHAARVPVQSYLPAGGHSLSVLSPVRVPLLHFLL